MSSVTKTTPTKATPTKLDGLHSKEVWILPKEISAKETETEEPLDNTEVYVCVCACVRVCVCACDFLSVAGVKEADESVLVCSQ